MFTIPKKLTSIRNQIIDQVHQKISPPKNLDEFISWFEDEGWDEILSGWGSEHIALKLDYIASLKFEDKEFIASEGIEEPITDAMRILYARRLIASAFEDGYEYDCPSVHAVEIRKPNGKSAVLGWLMEVHGQGGPVVYFQGAFLDKEHFYQQLRSWGYLFQSEQDSLSDEKILGLWTKKSTKKTRQIVVSVTWGNEQHECPMAERTWKRILQGKAVRRVEPYQYEGRRFLTEWSFNTLNVGWLIVSYDGDGIGFEGPISESSIWNDGRKSTLIEEQSKYLQT